MATQNHIDNFGDQSGFYEVEAMYLPLGTYVKALPSNGIFARTGTIIPALDQADFDAGQTDGVAITTAGWVEFYVEGAECDVADSAGVAIDANTVDQSSL